MSKNYAAIYESDNDAIALEQSFYVKEEITRGELIAPVDADFIFTIPGGTLNFVQPFEPSPHRSGRGPVGIIKKKKETSWSLNSYFNINEALGAPAATEIDPGIRALMKQVLGKEDTTTGIKFTRTVPATTVSIFECGDKFARQANGAFCDALNMQFPGDGEASMAFSGMAKNCLYVGIGKTTANNNGGTTVTLETDDGKQFSSAVGAYVMLIEADGTTRSADTPNGSPRKILSVVGDVVTLSGAALADADASVNDMYLVYYEPANPTAINNPVTGLQGALAVSGIAGSICPRSLSVQITNNHEVRNDCYGTDALAGSLFVAGARATISVSMEMNVNKDLIAFFNAVQAFESQVLQITLGDTTKRYLDMDFPKVMFPVPEMPIPESGSIPVTFEGTPLQTALNADDEISVHFK
jgi:hypothetical protein